MNRTLIACVLVLLLTAATGIYYKVRYLKFSLLPRDYEAMWQIEGLIQFQPDGNPIKVSLAAPLSQPNFRVFSLDELSPPDYTFHIVGSGDARRAEWVSGPATSQQYLLFRMKIYDAAPSRSTIAASAPDLGAEPYWEQKSNEYIANQLLELCDADAKAGKGLEKGGAGQTGKNAGVDYFNAFVLNVITQVFNPSENAPAGMLLPPAPTRDDRTRLVRKLLRQREIPSRLVAGVQLVDARRQQRVNMINTVEAFYNGAWHGFDVGEQRIGFPSQFLALRRGGKSLLDVEGGQNSTIKYTVTKTTIPASVLTAARNDALGKTLASLSVYDLPLESQAAFMRIALIPLGILIVVIIRNLIGIQTMGTFTPVLIALAFTDTMLLPGLVSFISIVTIGLVIRSYLSRLNLLLVPRIGAVVMVVIFLMKSYSLLSYKIGFNQGLSVTMFPLIILAWVIERAAILWEEDGPTHTIRQLLASLISGILCYGVMVNRYIRHVTFAFAEVDLIILALLLLLGCYTGYRLTELKRFRSLVKE